MQTCHASVRGRHAPSGSLGRRRQFLVGPPTTCQLGIPPHSQVARFATMCGLVAALSGLPARALTPPNDACVNAVSVGAPPSTTPGSTMEATVDPGLSLCVTPVTAPGVWYSFIGTGTTITANLCTGATTYDSKLSVFSGSCDVPVCIVGNDNSCGLQSCVTFYASPGVTYFFLVHGSSSNTGSFELAVSSEAACTTACEPPDPRPPLVQMPQARVEGGGAGPDYTFYMGIHEVTNEQYAVFLNDAERDGGASGLGAHMVFSADGSVTLNDGTVLFRPQGVAGTASRIQYDASAPIGDRYAVEGRFEQHPITSVTWFGALKFCNWLTLDQGIDCDQRSYTEGPAAGDWHPITISAFDWAVRDLNDAERQALVEGYAGFRLPMDNLRAGEGWIGDQDNNYNEWYKAMAYRPGAPGGVDPAGAAHPPDHAFYGFGRDEIDVASANYGVLYSDDLPVGSFDGGTILEPGGNPTLTRPHNNYFGIADLNGNVAEWLQDHAGSPFGRAVRGGHFDGPPNELLSSHRTSRAAISADAGTIGFRVTQTVFEMPTIEGDLFDKLRHAFSRIGLDQAATGILLNTGSFIYAGSIFEQTGSNTEAPPLDRDTFAGAYQDLVRSSVGTILPAYDALATAAENLRDNDHVAPIILAIVDYTMVDPAAWGDGRVAPSGEYYVLTSPSDPTVFQNRRFVGSSILAPRTTTSSVTFLLPSALLVNTTGEPIAGITIRLPGDPTEYGVEPDVPFDVPAVQFDEEGTLEYSMNIGVSAAPPAFGPPFTYSTSGKVTKSGCEDSCVRNCTKNICQCSLTHQCPPDCPAACPDSICGPLPDEPPYIHLTNPIVAAIPFENGNGELYVRIYPSPATYASPNPPPSLTGLLRRVVVAVDGFDPANCRTHSDIWCAFGDSLEIVRRDHDYDIVAPDYLDGRTYVQRNGLALRTLLKDHLPGWIDDDYKCRPLIVVSGSMGGQVGRYALRTMELAGEDHNVGLFIAIDSPFRGAAIPVGLQEATKFLAGLGQAGAQKFLGGLQSPAARELLRFYNVDPLHATYYDEVNSIGLPLKSRNVALASGTWDHRVDNLPKGFVANFADLNKTIYGKVCAFWNPFNGDCLKWVTTKLAELALNIKSDYPGAVFQSRLSALGITVVKLVELPHAVYVDLARGGLRNSPRQFRDAWNEKAVSTFFGGLTFDLRGMTGTHDYHSFIPLFSALNVEPPGGDELALDWVPSCPAPGQCTHGETPFDNAWFKPTENTGHVCQTHDGMSVMLGEIGHLEDSLLGIGACCLPDGTCQVMDGQCCVTGGGTPHGRGSPCRGDNDHSGLDDICECIDPPTGLVAWYTADDGSASDFLGNHNGVIVNENNSCLGFVGDGSLAFSSTNGPQYVDVPDSCELDPGDGDFTIDLWVNTSSDGPLLTKGLSSLSDPGYALSLVNNGHVFFGVSDGTNSVSTLSSTSVWVGWHHIAATVRRETSTTRATIYVDGMPGAPSVASLAFGSISSSCPLRIGASPSCTAPSQFFDGCIDEIDIFGRALGLSEVRAIFQAYTDGKCKDGCLPDPPSNCPNGVSGEWTAGISDDFDLTGIPDPLPNPGVCGTSAPFDWPNPNTAFCHTFSGLPLNIGGATLQIRLRSLGDSSCDDTLGLQWNNTANTFLWTRHIGSGPSASCNPLGAGLVSCPWDTLDDRHTFCLDLAALPLPSGATFNLLPFINGTLDVSLHDDTAVDYIRLLYDFDCNTPQCQPKPTGTACLGACPSGESCRSSGVTCYPGGCIISDCNCIGVSNCQAQLGRTPLCTGGCPLSSSCDCRDFVDSNPGSTTHRCGCCFPDALCADGPDGPCGDGLFCNGCETFDPDTSECRTGPSPCPPAFHCDEARQACVIPSIPTVSEWGLVVLTLLLLIAAKIYFARGETVAAS